MKINQISVASGEESDTIYGLGEDGLVYLWVWLTGEWVIYRR
jgi:hypothetical protein